MEEVNVPKKEKGVDKRKEAKKLKKKLKQIEKLESAGRDLNEEEQQKVDQKPDLLSMLANLSLH